MTKNKQREQENKKIKVLQQKKYSYSSWIFLVCILAFITYVRVRLLSTPLERDEGEYGYIAQLFLQGIPPFKAAFTMKLPGTSFMYALFMLLFGQTIKAIHLGLLIVNITSLVVLFLIVRRWFSAQAGIIAAASFALASLSPAVFGFAAHATHFVVVFALIGILILDRALENKRNLLFFISGLSFGCAFLMKQPGIFFFLFSISILILHKIVHKIDWKRIFRSALLLTGGFTIPVLILLSIVFLSGSFDKFWFWIVTYASQYGSMIDVHQGIQLLLSMMQSMWKNLPFFCVFTCIGLILFLTKTYRTTTSAMLFLLVLCSIGAVSPGLYFRPHYFILLIPACSILIGSAFHFFAKILTVRSAWKVPLLLVLMAALFENVQGNYKYYFITSPSEVIQQTYWANYFSESMVISDFVASHTTPDDRIAVIGSEPQIYFYAQRKSVSGHIYTYGMMEPQPYARLMQDDMISDIEKYQPKYILYFRIGFSWAMRQTSDNHIFQWTSQYTAQHYHPVCTVYPVNYFTVRYVWGNDIQQQGADAQKLIIIYERNDLPRSY